MKPGYKQTEVGVIPEDWEVRKLGEVFTLFNGCAFKPAEWRSSGTPIIRIQNLNDPTAEFNFSQAPVPERNRVEFGDLLFAWSGTLGSSFGARVWSGPSGVLNQHIFKVRADERRITRPFSLVAFARVEEDIARQAHGFKASFVHVKKSDLVKVDLPLPPLPEQRAIAEALTDVDGLLGGLDRLIAKKRDLKQAAMQQLLKPKDGWLRRTLDQIADVIDPHPSHRAPGAVSNGIPFVGIGDLDEDGNIVSEKVRLVPYTVYEEHSLRYQLTEELIGLGRVASIGKVVRIKPASSPYAISPTLGVIRATHVPREFLLYFLRSENVTEQFQRIMSGSTRSSVGMVVLRKLQIATPTTQPSIPFPNLAPDPNKSRELRVPIAPRGRGDQQVFWL